MAGDSVTLHVPPPTKSAIDPEAIPLSIFFEDDHLLVLDKPAGMITHPAGRVTSGTLVNALLAHCTQLSGINGVLRPGIVHRLDKDTSGLMVVAKSDEGHRGLAAQLAARAMARHYLALIWGGFDVDEGRVEAPIARHPNHRKRMAVSPAGRFAATRWRVRARRDFLSLLSRRARDRAHASDQGASGASQSPGVWRSIIRRARGAVAWHRPPVSPTSNPLARANKSPDAPRDPVDICPSRHKTRTDI